MTGNRGDSAQLARIAAMLESHIDTSKRDRGEILETLASIRAEFKSEIEAIRAEMKAEQDKFDARLRTLEDTHKKAGGLLIGLLTATATAGAGVSKMIEGMIR